MPMKPSFVVIHNEAESRFETAIDSHLAVLDYVKHGKIITFTHTGVPPALEGRGVGSELVKAGLAYARDNQLDVMALCWFVKKYMQRHPNE